MELIRPTCVLRPLVAADAAGLAAHADDREIWLNLRDRFPHPYRIADAEAFITAAAREPRPTTFGIVVDGEAAGAIGLEPGDDIERYTAEVGYWLGRRFWGRGVMTDALRAVTDHAFAELGLHRVFAVPFVRNVASCRVLEKAGYVREGRMRRSAVKAGEVLDQWLYAAVRGG
ncbi:MAG TPA: GNAT family protein [Gemmatimonadales bacterium]|nr:GNAT family protein [Gemmatimonadales bacterium]